jgi:hypothetical protein
MLTEKEKDLTPQDKFNLGAKYKHAGIAVMVAALIGLAGGYGMWHHGETLQLQGQSEARAQGLGTLTVTYPKAEPAKPDAGVLAVPLSGGSHAKGGGGTK